MRCVDVWFYIWAHIEAGGWKNPDRRLRQPRTGRSPPALRWKRGLKARTLRALSADSASSTPSSTHSQGSATPSARIPTPLDTCFRAFLFDAAETASSGHHAAQSASTDATSEASTSAASTDDDACCPSAGDTDESAGTFFLPTASMIGADTASSRTDATTSPEASPVRPDSPSLSSPTACSSPPLTNKPTAPAADEGSLPAAVAAPVDDDPADGPSSNRSLPRVPTPAPVPAGTGELNPRNSPQLLEAAKNAQPCQPAALQSEKPARRRRRFRRFVDFEPYSPPADGGVAHDTSVTVLYRPTERKATFLALSRDTIAAQLACVSGVRCVRVNFRRNVVAADVTRGADLAPLLAVCDISGVAVRSKALHSNSCVGVIYGVDPSFDVRTVKENIEAPVAVLSCSRSGASVTVTFVGSVVPTNVRLFKQLRAVRPRLPRPLQCDRCGVFGHAGATCFRDARCLRCRESHATGNCPAEKPRCVNCGGRHPSTEPSCPEWQRERRAAVLLSSSQRPLSRKTALELAGAATTEPRTAAPSTSASSPQGRSYSDALRGRNNQTAAAEPSCGPPTATNSDPRDALIAALAAALRALLDQCPAIDGNVRQMCDAALAAQEALLRHD
ncbi:pneumococcal serine-rich repeat protein-like [Dermacentor albipictus]|uniref:pneumococcal serine-rich repeat protein-like n=1 Tax=Dermacentor albipictus TaxID=60249 RepID=UPI0038FCAC5A